MEFFVRWISGKYAEVTVKDGGATIETGLLDKEERVETADILIEIAEELKSK